MRILPLLLIILAACTAKGARKPIAEERLLFVLHADSAHMEFVEGTTVTGTLHLHKVDDSVAFFSERPNRKAGTIPLKTFLANWGQGNDTFSLQPPNAGFIFFAPSESPRSSTAYYSEVNLTLQNPIYNKKKDTLSFDVTLLTPAENIPEGSLLELPSLSTR